MPLAEGRAPTRTRGGVALLAAAALALTAGLSSNATAASWSLQTPIASGGTAESLYDVSCATERRCVAVGQFLEERRVLEEGIPITVTAEPLAESWNGSSWSAIAAPRPRWATSSLLRGISCTSETSCMAVGSAIELFAGSVAVAMQWNGSAWTRLELPTAAEAEGGIMLLDVSCTSASACTATGVYHDSRSGSAHLLIQRWNGREWSLQTPPAAFGGLKAVACASETSCIAIGEGSLVAARWNGREWSEQTLASPSRGSNFPLGIACASASACMVVGEWETGSGTNAFGETWNGSSWTVSTPVTPTGARATRFEGVSCTSATSCVAAGAYTEASGAQLTLAESWNGSTWTLLTTPNPRGATSSFLRAISCSAAALCTADGLTSAGRAEALIERYA
jgi:hypothetical protein